MTGAVSAQWVTALRYATLAYGALTAAAVGWTLLDGTGAAATMHRSAVFLTALAATAVLYGTGLKRLRQRQPAWVRCAERMTPALGILALVPLFVVLGLEFLSYDAVTRSTPLAVWAITVVALSLVGLIATCIVFAVVPAHDPFAMPEHGRRAYVYFSEVMLVLFFIHMRLNVPWLFPRISGRYWPFVAMCVAYVGTGLSNYFRRKRLDVLAVPLLHTGVVLPLLPLLAFWAKPPSALLEFADSRLPGMRPLLDYLDRLPHDFRDYALVWFLLGSLYTLVAIANRSFYFALAAALAANFGFWALWHHHEVTFWVHPQLWLIPLTLILLTAEHWNRDRLQAYQSITLRYVALFLLYVSSTADMFIAGLGNSVLLPLVLALLSTLGVFAGILLRVRAFLFMGFAFMFLVVFSMIWHAAVDRYQTWVWWASGVALGACIIALFAVFEKRRNDILQVIEQVKQWET